MSRRIMSVCGMIVPRDGMKRCPVPRCGCGASEGMLFLNDSNRVVQRANPNAERTAARPRLLVSRHATFDLSVV